MRLRGNVIVVEKGGKTGLDVVIMVIPERNGKEVNKGKWSHLIVTSEKEGYTL